MFINVVTPMKSILALVLLIPVFAIAADAEFSIVIKNHRFEPAEITVPAGRKVKLLIENKDSTPEEFDSHALNREKVIMGNGNAVVYIGPLTPGRYPFVGEFNEATAQGVVVAQ